MQSSSWLQPWRAGRHQRTVIHPLEVSPPPPFPSPPHPHTHTLSLPACPSIVWTLLVASQPVFCFGTLNQSDYTHLLSLEWVGHVHVAEAPPLPLGVQGIDEVPALVLPLGSRVQRKVCGSNHTQHVQYKNLRFLPGVQHKTKPWETPQRKV